MRDSIGGSMLLYLVVIFATVIMLVFSSILTYSKAYKIKNRIIEIIEKYGVYVALDDYSNNKITQELNPDLKTAGYNASTPTKCDDIRARLTTGSDAKYPNLSENQNNYGYNYCVFESKNTGNGMYYVVVTFVEFQVPVIGDVLTFPVYSETKILGKDYSY